MLQEVDSMTTGVLEGPPSSPTQYASVMRIFRTIIRRCMVSISGMLGYTTSQHDIQHTFVVQPLCRHPREPVPEGGTRGVKRGAYRLPGGRARGGQVPAPPYPGRRGRADPGYERERGGGFGRRGLGDSGSYVPPDPFDSLDLDAPTFSLGLTTFALSHPSGAGTLYVPLDPFHNPDVDCVQPSQSAKGTLYALQPPSAIGLSSDALPPLGTTVDEDHSNIHQYVTVITQMVFDKLSMLYPDVEEDDEDDDNADEDYNVSSASDDDNNDNYEEDDISTLVNPLSSTIVNQWQI
ncbi:hypothetical protein M9H77_21509 [Catharanthus roseus]|uniref:Uncharacterized protein n=1 Tax=Catharanthus roseus TaxID=4058 RepID=A0ACC0AN85_CATRO|nr:hypothetical protein M9H77_21509 [Catharanthus roseus]